MGRVVRAVSLRTGCSKLDLSTRCANSAEPPAVHEGQTYIHAALPEGSKFVWLQLAHFRALLEMFLAVKARTWAGWADLVSDPECVSKDLKNSLHIRTPLGLLHV